MEKASWRLARTERSRVIGKGRLNIAAVCVAAALAGLPLASQGAGLDPNAFVTDEFLASRALAPINAQYAYARGYTGKGVLIAIVDSGLDVNHPEFHGRISPQLRNFFNSLGPEDVPDINRDGSIAGHGTHVAGLAAAARDGQGMHGVAYDATILPLRAIGADAIPYSPYHAIDRAIQAGAQVLNGSYGPSAAPPLFLQDSTTKQWYRNPTHRVVEYVPVDHQGIQTEYEVLKAAEQADMVLVFAAGNEFRDQPIASKIPTGASMVPLVTPANTHNGQYYRFLEDLPSLSLNDPDTWVEINPHDPRVASLDFSDLQGALIAVVSVDRNGTISSYSNRCGAAAMWCIAAPGGDFDTAGYSTATSQLWSTYPYSSYAQMAGTSMASPVVAGAAAVLRQAFPYMTARQIIEVVLTTANNSGQWGDKAIYGHGMLDLGKAVGGPAEFGAEGFPNVFDVDTKGYDSQWSNNISGSGGLIKRGVGTLTLSGTNIYTGSTQLAGGKLVVDGSIVSDLQVGKGAVLGGSGRVGNTWVWGKVTPGNSPGTLTVDGNYTQFAGSVLEVEFSSGASDRLEVTGTADIQGGELRVVGLTADTLGKDFTFLNAASITATSVFDTSRLGRAFIDLTPVFGPPGLASSIQMQVRRNATRFADLAVSGNQRAAAQAIESQGLGGAAYDPVVLMQEAGMAPGAFDQLSGEIYASTQSALVDIGGLLRQAAFARLYQAGRDGSPAGQAQGRSPSGNLAVWTQALGSWGELGASNDAGRMTRSTGGIMLGGDARLGDNAWAGMAASFTGSSFSAVGNASTRADGYHLTAYAGLQHAAWALRGGVSQSWYDLRTHRYVGYQNLGKASSSQHSRATQLFAEAGYALQVGSRTVLEPYAGLARMWLRGNDFQESGSAIALGGRANNFSITFSTLGARATMQLPDAGRFGMELTGGLGWRHAFGDRAPTANLQFASGNAYTVSGAPLARNALVAELGISLQASGTSRFSLSYAGQFAGATQDHGVQARAMWAF